MLLAGLGTVIVLGGCRSGVPGWVYVRPETPEAVLQADYAQCKKEARNIIEAIFCAYCYEDLVWNCMDRRGYALQQVTR